MADRLVTFIGRDASKEPTLERAVQDAAKKAKAAVARGRLRPNAVLTVAATQVVLSNPSVGEYRVVLVGSGR